ncbi:MAG: hypothetical protein RMJ31_02940 [Nitrososphaerota archaeon]|nr:hypothetical protein [Nitrososphaerota archaeon]
MTYCTISDVKALWFPGKNWTAQEDNELSNLIDEVSSEIDSILEKYATLPLQKSLADKLRYICAEWVAGRFRLNRGHKDDEKDRPSVIAAHKRLLNFIEVYFKRSFEPIGSD